MSDSTDKETHGGKSEVCDVPHVCGSPNYPASQVYFMHLLPGGIPEDPLKSPGMSRQEGRPLGSPWSFPHSPYDQPPVGNMGSYPGMVCVLAPTVSSSGSVTYGSYTQSDDPYGACMIVVNQFEDKDGSGDMPATSNAYEDSDNTGVIGPDGCWYPLHKNSHAGDLPDFEVDPNEEMARNMMEHDAELQEDNKESDTYLKVNAVKGNQSSHRPPPHLPIYNCFHHLNLPEDFLGRPVLLPTRRTKSHLCVFDMLVEYMNLLFRNLPDQWELKVAKRNCKAVTGWSTFKDFAKVRFYCKGCQVGWTSMRGVVMFSYRWNWRLQHGQVLYHILGQKCSACNPGTFEMPIWYPEEAQKIVTNLYYKICSEVYGLKTPQPIRTRRPGTSGSSHNGNLCQGCIRGVCLVN